MHIILSNLIWRDGELQTAIAPHMPAEIPWTDSISGDGKTCASIVLAELSEPVVAAIKADRDVLDYFYKSDPAGALTVDELAKVERSALRHGVPMDAMPAVPVAADVAEAVKRRMLLSQITVGKEFETSDKIERKTIERLKDAGFDVDTVDVGDDPDTRIKKAQKLKVPPGG